MYLIKTDTNTIEKVETSSFSELKFSERNHLQEWIAKNPEALGEELLIIQKEFNGFDDTLERLDLLALDKNYNLVVIENKLDDSGRDVTWQALKYASYCSTLSGSDIKRIYQDYLDDDSADQKAEENLYQFFKDEDYEEKLNIGNSLRIILVAAKFRKEVTSTVLWLLNYGIKMQCHRVTPYQVQGQAFLSIEQIIPLRDAEDYTIKIAKKAQDQAQSREDSIQRNGIRKEFWQQLLSEFNNKSDLFKSAKPGYEPYIIASSGIGNCPYVFTVNWRSASVSFSIQRAVKAENDSIFHSMLKRRSEIEAAFGDSLNWSIEENRKKNIIEFKKEGFDYRNKNDWPAINEFLVESMVKLERATKSYLQEIASEAFLISQ